ncbi:DUF6395 domain-containing protein [Granulosicoccus sp.]|nr:DUF6395 domain-containing protein [Granulosicoccus sp.]MDB4223370.1 DUF6395 domain-containing protein [Granulosicoccus sp.]
MRRVDYRINSRCNGSELETSILLANGTNASAKIIFPTDKIADNAYRHGLVQSAFGLIAAQSVFHGDVYVNTPLNLVVERNMSELGTLFRSSHSYSSKADSTPVKVSTDNINEVSNRREGQIFVGEKRALLLWSGGKDCLASLHVLRKNGFDVAGVHVTANFTSKDRERTAANELAEQYGLTLYDIPLSWDSVKDLIKENSGSYDTYPLNNAIPHGRDLVLIIIAAEIAKENGYNYICAGYEADLWRKYVSWNGQSIARHDVQSSEAGNYISNILLEQYGMKFFSPIAGVTELSILNHIMNERDQIWENIESCFWGGWCGQCSKCLRYHLVELALNRKEITFRNDPIEPSALALLKLLSTIEDPNIAYWEQQVWSIYKISQRKILPEDHPIVQVVEKRRGWYESINTDICSVLANTYDNSLAPTGFHPYLELPKERLL